MRITAKRVYAAPAGTDGTRLLVDRLWPRGFSKAKAPWDRWVKDIAPSDLLRRRVHGKPHLWAEFCQAYEEELDDKPELVEELLTMAEDGPLTLLYASRQEDRNNATVLRDYLMRQAKRR
jgi:uncharacterized protein YeaO (DUF488 family)